MRGKFLKYAGICLIAGLILGQPYLLFGQGKIAAVASSIPSFKLQLKLPEIFSSRTLPLDKPLENNPADLNFHPDNNENLYAFLQGTAGQPIFQEKTDPVAPPADEVATTLPENAAPVAPKPIVKKAVLPPTPSINGRCSVQNDKPGWSERKEKNHMDEDCCPDYDEWPNPGCYYSSKDFTVMLAAQTKGHRTHR